MNTFPLIISSPDGDLFRGDVEKLILRGTEGDLAVMAGHVPFVTAVKAGCCVLEDAEGKRKAGRVEEGLLTVGKEKTTLLTSLVAWEDQKQEYKA